MKEPFQLVNHILSESFSLLTFPDSYTWVCPVKLIMYGVACIENPRSLRTGQGQYHVSLSIYSGTQRYKQYIEAHFIKVDKWLNIIQKQNLYSQILDTFPKLSVIKIEIVGQAKCVHLFKFLEEFVCIYLHFNGALCINLIVYFCVRIPNVSIKRGRFIGSFRGYIIAGI